MMTVGVLTLAVAARDSVIIGGFTSAMVGLGVACCGPLIGAAADRFGQRPVLLITAIANSIALGALAWIAFANTPVWLMLIGAFLCGATAPQTSPMSRSRLVTIVQNDFPTERVPKMLNGTLAYESAADEVVFVFGPVVVGLLATLYGGWVPIAGAAVLTLVFVSAFAVHRTSIPAKSHAERAATLAPVSELWRAPLVVTVIGIFAVGLFFGSMLTSLTAFMQDRGAPEEAGLLYGVMGIGSAALAIGAAWFPAKFTLRARWIVFATIIMGGTLLLLTVDTVPGVLMSLAVMGLGVGPMLVTLYGFGTERTPEGRSATVMTLLGSGVVVGQSVATALTGTVADLVGTEAALTLPLLSAVIMLIAGIVNYRLTPPGYRSLSTQSVTIQIP